MTNPKSIIARSDALSSDNGEMPVSPADATSVSSEAHFTQRSDWLAPPANSLYGLSVLLFFILAFARISLSVQNRYPLYYPSQKKNATSEIDG
jgi:hypothetical protein